MITVRQASPADAEVLAELNRAFNGVERGRDCIRESLVAGSSPETVFVAEDGPDVVGFMCLQTLRSVCYDAPWVEITELYVASTHRGRGAGRALLRAAEGRAEGVGASELLLRTNVKNRPAQNLCSQSGLGAAQQVVFRRSYAA